MDLAGIQSALAGAAGSSAASASSASSSSSAAAAASGSSSTHGGGSSSGGGGGSASVPAAVGASGVPLEPLEDEKTLIADGVLPSAGVCVRV